ncbi:uncharacterized protein [Littorina saxatilis]|uniref:BTB/POZ domain-containing protein n=1 Tax=Littorina saxatilis TaxID=31220 RepID=A0AAN9BQI5_9CAEN
MDFSKFRTSGDLSDMTVLVEGVENNLHRFPLYAKSEFFCGLARGPPFPQSPSFTKSRVELTDFPGGQTVFAVVADFCYNMSPKVTKDNVVELRCAALRLQMEGPGNLADAADKFLQDTVASAKLSRSSSSLVTLLLHCASVGQLAADSGVVSICTDALVDTWLRSPGKFSPTASSAATPGSAFTLQGSAFTPMKPSTNALLPPSSSSTCGSGDVTSDDVMMDSLCKLPEDWFAALLTKALEKGVRQSQLAEMAVRYVSTAIDSDELEGRRNRNGGGGLMGDANGHSTPVNDSGSVVDSSAFPDLDKDIDSAREEVENLEVSNRGLPSIPDRDVDLGVLLDTVLTTLPEDAYNLPSLTMEWLTKVLRISTAHGCSCRQFLVKIAADKLTRLSSEDLCIVSPSVLHDIVLEAKADDTQAERACALVDTYLGEMTKKGVLTAETFRLLASAAPPNMRKNHDNLYEVLEYVLRAEKDSLNAEQRQELLSTINLDLVTEETLQRLLDSDLVSPEPVARASLKLCSSLRTELESVKYIAQMQEEELTKYQSRSSPQPSPRGAGAFVSSSKIDSDSGFSDTGLDSNKPGQQDANEHVRAAQSVLSTARSKLAMPLYTGHRPYVPSSTSTSHYPLVSGLVGDHDSSLQDELEFGRNLDRPMFRSLEPRVRSRHYPVYIGSTSSSSSSHPHHRSTYFPYSQRY